VSFGQKNITKNEESRNRNEGFNGKSRNLFQLLKLTLLRTSSRMSFSENSSDARICSINKKTCVSQANIQAEGAHVTLSKNSDSTCSFLSPTFCPASLASAKLPSPKRMEAGAAN
jgi:hypothetical protein